MEEIFAFWLIPKLVSQHNNKSLERFSWIYCSLLLIWNFPVDGWVRVWLENQIMETQPLNRTLTLDFDLGFVNNDNLPVVLVFRVVSPFPPTNLSKISLIRGLSNIVFMDFWQKWTLSHQSVRVRKTPVAWVVALLPGKFWSSFFLEIEQYIWYSNISGIPTLSGL